MIDSAIDKAAHLLTSFVGIVGDAVYGFIELFAAVRGEVLDGIANVVFGRGLGDVGCEFGCARKHFEDSYGVMKNGFQRFRGEEIGVAFTDALV